MPFVKLDCGILNSTLWFERTAREIFITALLMAEPYETTEPLAQIEIGSLGLTGWQVPPGWYGFVPAASVGILHRAGITDETTGLSAMSILGQPEASSRSKDFDGRRLVRVDGGFIVLNFMKYRDRDYTAAERSRRYRERIASRRSDTASHRNITQAEVEAEADTKDRGSSSLQAAKKNGVKPCVSGKRTHTPTQPVSLKPNGATIYGNEHRAHAACGRICVPAFLHREFKTALGGNEQTADKTIRDWYQTTWQALDEDEAVEPDSLKFWRPRFKSQFVKDTPNGKTAEQEAADILAVVQEQRKRAGQ